MAKKRRKRAFADRALQAGMEIARPGLKAANLVFNTASFGLNVARTIALPFLKGLNAVELNKPVNVLDFMGPDPDDEIDETREYDGEEWDQAFKDEYGEEAYEDTFGEDDGEEDDDDEEEDEEEEYIEDEEEFSEEE